MQPHFSMASVVDVLTNCQLWPVLESLDPLNAVCLVYLAGADS